MFAPPRRAGLVAPLVSQRLMGTAGEIVMIILLLMAVTSTGSAEIIAVTSILVYDIYQLYLRVNVVPATDMMRIWGLGVNGNTRSRIRGRLVGWLIPRE